MVIRSTPEWKTDTGYQTFIEHYRSTGGAFIDEDFAAAFQFGWKILDWEQKAARLASLDERIKAEAWDNPRFVPKPEKFLKSEWQRPILARVAKQKGPVGLAEVWKSMPVDACQCGNPVAVVQEGLCWACYEAKKA